MQYAESYSKHKVHVHRIGVAFQLANLQLHVQCDVLRASQNLIGRSSSTLTLRFRSTDSELDKPRAYTQQF
jgi:hypothetical protein